MFKTSDADRRLERLLRRAIVAGVYALTFIPLIVTSSLVYPAVTGKSFAFRILSELILGAWVALALLDRRYRPRRSPILWSLAVLLAAIGMANVFGVDPHRSFWSTLARADGYVTLLHFCAVVLVAGSVLRSTVAWRRIVATSVAVSVSIALLAGMEFLFANAITPGAGVRVMGTLGNPAYLGTYLLLHLFLAAWLVASHRRGTIRNVLLGLTMMLLLAVLMLTGTRGAIVGLAGGGLLAMLAFVALRLQGGKLIRFAAATLLVGAVLLGAVAASQLAALAPAPGVNEPSGDSSAADSSKGVVELVPRQPMSQLRRLLVPGSRGIDNGLNQRLAAWKVAARGVVARPLLGWGQENFELVVERHYNSALHFGGVFDRPHNVLAGWAVAGGLLGLTAYLSVLAAAFHAAWRSGKQRGAASGSILVGLLGAWFINNLFLFETITSYLVVSLVLAYLHGTRIRTDTGDQVPEPLAGPMRPWGRAVIAGLAVTATLITMYAVNAELLRVAWLWHHADPRAAGRTEYKLGLMERALATGDIATEELRGGILELALVAYREPISPSEKERYLSVATSEMQAAIATSPARFRHRLDLGRFLALVDRLPEAREQLTAAVRIVPGNQAARIALAAVHEGLGEYALASESARRAYELDPRHAWPRQVYSALELLHGNVERAIGLLGPQNDDAFPQASISPLLREIASDSGLDPAEQAWLAALVDFGARRGSQRGASGTIRGLARTFSGFAPLEGPYLEVLRPLEEELRRREWDEVRALP